MSFAAVCTAALLLTSCSSVSGTAVAEPEPAAAPSTSPPPTPPRVLADYLPQLRDMPAGYVEVPFDESLYGEQLDKTEAATDVGVVTPAECQGVVTAEAMGKMEKSGFANTTTSQMIIGMGSAEPGYIDRFRQYNLGPCASVQRTGVASSGTAFTGTSMTEIIDVEVPGIDGAVVVRHDTVDEIGDLPPQSKTDFVALLPVEGGTILLSQVVMLSSDVPDIEVFKAVVASLAHRATGK